MSVHLAVFLAVLNQIGLKGSKMLVALYAIELHASPFAIGISHVASQNLVGSLGDADARTSNFGTFSLGAAIAGMIGPMLVGFMVDRAGYSMSYFALAAISIIPGIFLLGALKNQVQHLWEKMLHGKTLRSAEYCRTNDDPDATGDRH